MFATRSGLEPNSDTAVGARGVRAPARAWVITGLLLVFMLINFADKAVLGLAARPIMHDLGLSATQYGLVSSGFFLLFSIAALGVGFLTDRVPTRWVIFTVALVWAVTQLPMVTTVGFGVLLSSRIVLGAAEGPAFPVANHALHKWFPDAQRNVPSSILVLGAPLGVVITAPALSWLLVHHGWHSAFAVLAAIGIAWCFAWLVAGREGSIGTTADTGAGEEGFTTYWRILGTGTWLASVLAGFAAYWAVSLLIAWLPHYLETALGYDAVATGNLVALVWGIGGLAQLAQGLVTSALMRRGRSSRAARGFLGGGCVLVAGLAMAAFALAPAGWPKIVCMVIGFSIGGVIFPIAQTVCAEITPTGRRGGVLGAYAAVYATSGVAAPYLTGELIDSGNGAAGYQTTFLISAALLVLGGIAAVVFIRPARDACVLT